MTMEAEVMRSRCVALLAQVIEVGEMAGKRSVTLDEMRALMLTMMRAPLPGEAKRVLPQMPQIESNRDLLDMGAHDGAR